MINLDLDGFERYCKNIYFIKSINAYKGYLEKGVGILNQISSDSIEEFVSKKEKDAKYLKNEFTKQIEIQKLHNDLYNDFSSAAKKYSEFKKHLYPIPREEILQKYDSLWNEISVGGLKKLKNQNMTPFTLEVNSTSLCVRGSDGNGQECMSVSKDKILRVLFEDEPYTYPSYEPTIINIIFGIYDESDYKKIVEELYKQLEDVSDLPKMNYTGENYIQFNILSKYGIHLELWLIDKDGMMYLDIHQEKRTKELNNNFIERMRTIIGSNEKYIITNRERNKDFQIIRQSKAYNKNEILNRVNEIANDVIEMDKLFREPILTYFNSDQNFEISEVELKGKKMFIPLNQILYGPPGTGKTYNTINKALKIIFEKASDDEKSKAFEIKRDKKDTRAQQCTYAEAIENDDRPALKSIFDYYKDEAEQIVFTTFHQSYGYEEFVEGIKALEPDHEENQTDDLVYRTMPGIFKRLTTKAQLFDTEDDFRIEINTKVWKISLEGARESVTKKYCFENDVIRIGWDDYGDLNNAVKQLNTSLKYFYTAMSEGDLVISLYDAKHIDGIGIIVGGYFYDANLGEYCHCRKVKWFVKNKKMYFYDINDKRNLVQSTIYRLWHVNKNSLMELIASENKTFSSKKNEKNYVLIIDEINRGNISKIFGELITLIEPSKRIDEEEEIEVTLPYSGDPFGVPNNLYIIGTMNTADRSIAQIDTALRRRFEFLEMLPNYQVLCEQGIKELTKDQANSEEPNGDDLLVDNINVRLLLKAINERIEYIYDREHQIGHSYFMPLKASPTKEKLDEIFRVNIIPLLAEYFYGDWADIKVILNDIKDDFITVKEESNLSFEMMSSKRKKNRIYNVNSKEFSIEAYINIYKFKS